MNEYRRFKEVCSLVDTEPRCGDMFCCSSVRWTVDASTTVFLGVRNLDAS
jgi:hypothetical protein